MKYRNLDGKTEYYPYGVRTRLRRNRVLRGRLIMLWLLLCGAAITALFVRQTVYRGGQPQPVAAEPPAPTATPTLFPEAIVVHDAAATQAPTPTPDETDQVLPMYAELYSQNPEMIGWLEIPGTNVNYPVMQTPGDNVKYLHLGFDGQFSMSGSLFLDERCSVTKPTANLMIYGHNMADGSMFSDLLDYQEEAFFLAHPTLRFDTIYQTGEWQVLAAFYATVDDSQSFQYYTFFDADKKPDWEYFYDNVKALSLYDTGVEAEFGDQLLTLSTCAKAITTDDRFVVVAKKVEG